MTNFIKLTEIVKSVDNHNMIEIEAYVNADNIESIKIARSGRDTIITMMNGRFYFVKQKVNEVLDIINGNS